MKVDVNSPEFQPITITLETLEEAIVLRELVGRTSPHNNAQVLDKYGYDSSATGPTPRAFSDLYLKVDNSIRRLAPEKIFSF